MSEMSLIGKIFGEASRTVGAAKIEQKPGTFDRSCERELESPFREDPAKSSILPRGLSFGQIVRPGKIPQE